MSLAAEEIDAGRGVESGRRYPAGGRDLGAVQPVTPAAGHSLPDYLETAWRNHRAEAMEADALFRSWVDPGLGRVPGCDTVVRLAHRISCGRSVEEAATREYLYRWSLALKSRVFGAPHVIGL